jgi:hypothetical protein
MDLSPVKLEILQALLLFDKPVKALQVAKEVGKNCACANAPFGLG